MSDELYLQVATNTYQGSNSWIMLSKRMTAKSLEQKPANQASDSTVNLSSDCRPKSCSDCDLLASFDLEDDLPVAIAIAYSTTETTSLQQDWTGLTDPTPTLNQQ